MPLIFPTNPSNGDTYTDDNSAVWQFDGVKWNVVTGTTKKLFNGVSVGITTDYALTATLYPVTWDQEDFDTGFYYSAGDPTKITIQQEGYYNLDCNIFTSTAGAGFDVRVVKNGSTTIAQTELGSNQSGELNSTVYFSKNDYIQLQASESSAAGSLTTSTSLEVILLGLAMGTGVSNYSAFSGAKAVLDTNYATTSTLTAVDWDDTAFNVNANAEALTYWTVGDPSKLTVKVNGYYNIRSFLQMGSEGGPYDIQLKKNGTAVLSTSSGLSPNDTAKIDETYYLSANDYVQIMISDALAAGSLSSLSYFEITRKGV